MDCAPGFGKATGQLGGENRTTFAWVALIWHVSMLAMFYLILRYGARYRRAFS